MADNDGVRSVPELYAHALAIEREAAARYLEFADRMADEGNDQLATLFRSLASFESEHVNQLVEATRQMRLPDIPAGAYAWLDASAPETAAHDFVFRLMTPHDALEIALAAERRARRFFDEVYESATDAALRDLALDMAREEDDHVAWVERALATNPDPHVDWEKVLEGREAGRPD